MTLICLDSLYFYRLYHSSCLNVRSPLLCVFFFFVLKFYTAALKKITLLLVNKKTLSYYIARMSEHTSWLAVCWLYLGLSSPFKLSTWPPLDAAGPSGCTSGASRIPLCRLTQTHFDILVHRQICERWHCWHHDRAAKDHDNQLGRSWRT